jgi:hypothetical protein
MEQKVEMKSLLRSDVLENVTHLHTIIDVLQPTAYQMIEMFTFVAKHDGCRRH